MDSVDLRRLEDVVEEVSGWAGIGLSPMHLSIKLSHVILMNMKYKSQPSREKLRERALGRRCVEVERKWQWLLRDGKFTCFFSVCLFVWFYFPRNKNVRTELPDDSLRFTHLLGSSSESSDCCKVKFQILAASYLLSLQPNARIRRFTSWHSSKLLYLHSCLGRQFQHSRPDLHEPQSASCAFTP